MTMPVLFVGHGSPMNAIENNTFASRWRTLGQQLPTPKAILVISAHWYTTRTQLTAMEWPKTIHDFYGFPQPLFDVQYPAPGAPELAVQTRDMLENASLDHQWGLDHGTWSILVHMYPEAHIPVVQLSINRQLTGDQILSLGSDLKSLRNKGVLILGSGNLVHNLSRIQFGKSDGFDWALEAESTLKQLIETRKDKALSRYQDLGKAVQLAVPTPDHYLPLLYTLGATDTSESQSWFNVECSMGSLSMASVAWGLN